MLEHKNDFCIHFRHQNRSVSVGCSLRSPSSLVRRKHTIPTLYRMCLRIIARNIEKFNRDDWNLSHLPSTIKVDLLQLNMKLSIGFSNENIFIQLLTPNITQLSFRAKVVTDAMLDCIGERCKNLQELRIFDDKYRRLQMTTDGLNKCIKNLKMIKSLQISESDKVTNETIEIISQNCPHLESLWLNECNNVTDDSSEFLKSMKLNDLNLEKTGITDEWLLNTVDSTLMESLRDICLRNCDVTHDGLQHLNWSRLENINIIGVLIEDLSFIPQKAAYKTLNWTV